jgi:hypothetical protein
MRRIIWVAMLLAAAHQTASLAQSAGSSEGRVETYRAADTGVTTCVGTCYAADRSPQTETWRCETKLIAPTCQVRCEGGQPRGTCSSTSRAQRAPF